MKLPILSVKDRLLGFGTTFTAANEEVAIRGFSSSIKRCIDGLDFTDSIPEDLSLYRLGYFDTESGVIESSDPCVLVFGHDIATKMYVGDENDNKKI